MPISTPLRDRSSSSPLPAPSDPDSLAHELATHLASVGDLSSWSDELAAVSTAWPLSYFLSPARANVLRGLHLPVDGVVLEIGSRAGALTRYLGEEASLVDALEPDASMAHLTATRCADLDTVAVHPVWLDSVPAEPVYDLVVAVDVLGELAQRQVPLEQFVADCRARLRPGGVLVLCADNADGVRRRAGGLPPAPGIASPLRPSWTTAGDLRDAADACGLQADVVSAFPDHRLTKVVLDPAALADVDPRLVEALPSFPSPTYGVPTVQPDLEGALWSSLVRSGSADGGANSLVAVIGEAATTTDEPAAVATYWSLGRAAALSARNRIVLDDGRAVVERRHAFPRAPGPDGPLSLRPHTEAYVAGVSLVDRLLDAGSAAEAQGLLGRWVDLVTGTASEGDVPWDLIARNLVIDADDTLRPIDQEWALEGATAATVLRRGCFWLASDLLDAPSTPPWLRGRNHGQVADFLWRLAGQGHDDTDDWLATFVAEEARATSFVSPLKPPRSRAHAERQNGNILSAISRSSTEHEPGQDDQQAPETDAPSLQAVVDSLLETNEQLRDQLEALNRQRRHDALTQRDHLIGMTAELEVMRDRVGRAQAAQKLAMTKVRRLRKQVADMQASSTWRIGRTVVRPIARLRGRR